MPSSRTVKPKYACARGGRGQRGKARWEGGGRPHPEDCTQRARCQLGRREEAKERRDVPPRKKLRAKEKVGQGQRGGPRGGRRQRATTTHSPNEESDDAKSAASCSAPLLMTSDVSILRELQASEEVSALPPAAERLLDMDALVEFGSRERRVDELEALHSLDVALVRLPREDGDGGRREGRDEDAAAVDEPGLRVHGARGTARRVEVEDVCEARAREAWRES